MKRQLLLPSLAVIAVALICATGCNLPGASSASAAVDNSSTDSGSTSSGGGGTSSSGGGGSSSSSSSSSGATSYGLNCTGSNGADRADATGGDPYIIIPSTSGLTGSSVNSVQLTLYWTDNTGQEGNASPVVSTVSLTAYSCVPPGGPLGSSVATANMTSNVLHNSPTAETFSFGGGLTIPTNCASGDYPLVFELNYGGGYELWAATGYENTGTSCYVPRSTNGYTKDTRSYALVITANP